MEVYRRRTSPWVWVAIVGIAAAAVLVVVWLVAAGPAREEAVRPEEQPRLPPEEERPAQEMPRELIIRDRETVREVVGERPVYVYIERPERQGELPREVVVVPRDSEAPATGYERVDLPATFVWNDREYIIEPGRLIRAAPDELESTGRHANGYTVYRRAGDESLEPVLYLGVRPDSDIYVRYEPSE